MPDTGAVVIIFLVQSPYKHLVTMEAFWTIIYNQHLF